MQALYTQARSSTDAERAENLIYKLLQPLLKEIKESCRVLMI
jgi:hypothetical protein